MSKPSKTSKTQTQTPATSTPKATKAKTPKTARGVGRPRYEATVPQGKFTMRQFCEINGVDPETGKGEKCSKLTLIKFLARDAKKKGMSMIVRLKDETRAPAGEKGLGRKAFVFVRRSKLGNKVAVDVGTQSDATVNVPVVDVTPAPATPAPVDATPASTETVNA